MKIPNANYVMWWKNETKKFFILWKFSYEGVSGLDVRLLEQKLNFWIFNAFFEFLNKFWIFRTNKLFEKFEVLEQIFNF
jgi:hypothetical protein